MMALLFNKAKNLKPFDVLYKTFYRNFSNNKFVSDVEVKKCYNILGIPEDSDQESIRSAYLDLVKKYHPDSGHPEADSDKFQEIDKAFRIILTKKSTERWSADEVNFEVHAQIFDIKHTAPQHRQYLNYDGMGVGTPAQRQKQYEKIRAMQAADNVMNHRINKAQADDKSLLDKKPLKHNIKTKYGFDRLVEDLIQEAMSKGEFDNLSGKGKPLRGLHNTNPYVDSVTHKLNQVLMENGFTPEWIMLQKEITEAKKTLLQTLNTHRSQLGVYPFCPADNYKWDETLENIKTLAEDLNKKIEKYNLVVPILQKQMIHFNLEKESKKIAMNGTVKQLQNETKVFIENHLNPKNILSLLEYFFTKSKI